MTRRTSSRALAREIYREMVAGRVRQGAAPTPDPSPLLARARGGGEKTDLAAHSLAVQSLTEKTRALYENAAVPVAEIARLCGVTERTIYKYARRENWTPRYRWSGDGGRPRGASWRAADRVAPVKGAGGRFIRRADKGKPFASGLKATDPQAAARAKAACAEAEARARTAEEEAEMEALYREYDMASKGLHRAMDDLIAYQKRRVQHKGAKPPADDAWEQAMVTLLNVYRDWRRDTWEEIKSHWHKGERPRPLSTNRVTAP